MPWWRMRAPSLPVMSGLSDAVIVALLADGWTKLDNGSFQHPDQYPNAWLDVCALEDGSVALAAAYL